MVRKRLIVVVLVLLVSFLLSVGALKALRLFWPAPPVGLVKASGRIEGRITTLTPKSFARVSEIRADEGQFVSPGDVLAVLDDPALRERLNAAQARWYSLLKRLQAADTQLAMMREQVQMEIERATDAVKEAKAKLRKAHATLAQARKDAERLTRLAAKDLVTRQEAEHAVLQAAIEEQEVHEAEASVAQAEKQLALARLGTQRVRSLSDERDAQAREVVAANAQVAELQSYAEAFIIRSPIEGTILTRTVEVGEQVNVGMPLFTLVNLDQLYLKVFIPEPQIGLIALGQDANIYVNAFPEQAFPAKVSKVAQQAEFTPKNVETKEERVKLVFAVELSISDNPGGVLKPGMPADAVIRVRSDASWERP